MRIYIPLVSIVLSGCVATDLVMSPSNAWNPPVPGSSIQRLIDFYVNDVVEWKTNDACVLVTPHHFYTHSSLKRPPIRGGSMACNTDVYTAYKSAIGHCTSHYRIPDSKCYFGASIVGYKRVKEPRPFVNNRNVFSDVVARDSRRYRMYVAEVSTQQAQKRAVARRKAEAEAERNQQVLRNNKCISFGFQQGSNLHTNCVVQLAIAEEAQRASEVQAMAYMDAVNQARREAERRRAVNSAMRILGKVANNEPWLMPSAGGPSNSGVPGVKTCYYDVSGRTVSQSMSVFDFCPATMKFGLSIGFLK